MLPEERMAFPDRPILRASLCARTGEGLCAGAVEVGASVQKAQPCGHGLCECLQ